MSGEVILEFVCGTHGPFRVSVHRSRLPCVSAGCLADVPIVTPHDFKLHGKCTQVSCRADINHDPGDEDRSER